MLSSKNTIICANEKADFCTALTEILNKLSSRACCISLTFFWEAVDNERFLSDKNFIEEQLKAHFGECCPTTSYVGQKCLGTSLALELVEAHTTEGVHYKSYKGNRYVVLEKGEEREWHIRGLSADVTLSVHEQARRSFETLKAILDYEGLDVSDIVRQWNYIERITEITGKRQRYQDFNDARTYFYKDALWHNGFPAATGIGTQNGGVVIDAILMQGKQEILPIRNPLQIDAHSYTQEVLIGEPDTNNFVRTTPKFERAKQITDNAEQTLLISGTAAIRGEQSLYHDDAVKQVLLTLDNIQELMRLDNPDRVLSTVHTSMKLEYLRVYVKEEKDFMNIKRACEDRHPSLPILYTRADICREELLVEAEGVALGVLNEEKG